MIAYEIQLRYVIRDKIQSEKKSEKNKFVREKFCRKKICLGHCLGFPVHFLELSLTSRCLSSLSGIYIPQLHLIIPTNFGYPIKIITHFPNPNFTYKHTMIDLMSLKFKVYRQNDNVQCVY